MGCSVKDSVFINDSSLIESSLNFGVVSCYNFTDGSLSVLSTGGIGPYTYFWSNGQSGLGLTSINNLSSEIIITTRDALGCVVIDSIDIPNPDPLYVTAQELLRVGCNGLSDGQAFAVGTGGTSPYNLVGQELVRLEILLILYQQELILLLLLMIGVVPL